MGRTVRQKRKNRSSRPKVKQPNKIKKQLNPLGNDIIARNWDKNETLTQNYRRLGLLTRLQAPTGGSEPLLLDGSSTTSSTSAAAPLKIATKAAAPGALREVRVERDASGRIVRVINDSRSKNPLNDPLNELESDSDSDEDGDGEFKGFEDGWDAVADPTILDEEEEEEDEEVPVSGRRRKGTKVVDELERLARRPVVKEVRTQSAREVEWLERLVARHGDDYGAMARDQRLNPMQQTERDIARRVGKLKQLKQ